MRGLAAAATMAMGMAAGVGAPAAADPSLAHFEQPARLTRDAALNRAVTRSPMAWRSSATAQGNLISVQQAGRGNTLMLNVTQTNTGAVSANSVLNGGLNLE